MSEHPILFSAPMVRALLDGTKTQTRRVVKPYPVVDPACGDSYFIPPSKLTNGVPVSVCAPYVSIACQHGQPGDKLWVRENFSGPHHQSKSPPRDWLETDPIWYWADGNPDGGDWTKTKPGIFMPRWASRILLEITCVWLQNLNEISRGDAMAEGCPFPNMAQGNDPRRWYADLWQQINGPDSWSANPFVWVIEFKRVTP